MSNLTDAQEKDYTRQIASLLEEYKPDLLAAPEPYDPTQRILNLTNGSTATDKAEAAIPRAEKALEDAIDLKNHLRTTNYNLAQASVGQIESTLGKDSAAAQKARDIRSEMSNPEARHPHGEPPAPPK
jgi:hypothetical protein